MYLCVPCQCFLGSEIAIQEGLRSHWQGQHLLGEASPPSSHPLDTSGPLSEQRAALTPAVLLPSGRVLSAPLLDTLHCERGYGETETKRNGGSRSQRPSAGSSTPQLVSSPEASTGAVNSAREKSVSFPTRASAFIIVCMRDLWSHTCSNAQPPLSLKLNQLPGARDRQVHSQSCNLRQLHEYTPDDLLFYCKY